MTPDEANYRKHQENQFYLMKQAIIDLGENNPLPSFAWWCLCWELSPEQISAVEKWLLKLNRDAQPLSAQTFFQQLNEVCAAHFHADAASQLAKNLPAFANNITITK